MLLQLKTSELGGGRNPPPQVQRVFKGPGEIRLRHENIVPVRMPMRSIRGGAWKRWLTEKNRQNKRRKSLYPKQLGIDY